MSSNLTSSSGEAIVQIELLDTAGPYLACVLIGCVLIGVIFVQIITYLQSINRRERRFHVALLLFMLSLVLASFLMVYHAVVDIGTIHFGELSYLLSLDRRPESFAQPILSIILIFLCQVCLLHRSCAFSVSFKGRLPASRWILVVFLSALAILSCITGILSFAFVRLFSSSYVAELAAQGSKDPTFETMTGLWLSASLLVDIVVTGVITFDLRQAMLFDAQHASHQAVKPRSREILSRLAVLTVRNGSFIALSQLAFLIMSLSNDTTWTHSAMVIMPSVQYCSLLAVLNKPHRTVQDQCARTAQDVESQNHQHSSALPSASSGSSVGDGHPPMRETGLTVLERGRRKLPALVDGKKRRSKGEKTSLS